MNFIKSSKITLGFSSDHKAQIFCKLDNDRFCLISQCTLYSGWEYLVEILGIEWWMWCEDLESILLELE